MFAQGTAYGLQKHKSFSDTHTHTHTMTFMRVTIGLWCGIYCDILTEIITMNFFTRGSGTLSAKLTGFKV